MSKHAKYTPKHRQARSASVPKKALRNTLVLSSVAVAATGVTVGGGLASSAPQEELPLGASAVAADLEKGAAKPAEDEASDTSGTTLDFATRSDEEVSRSDRRTDADTSQAAALLSTDATTNAITRTEDLSEEDPRDVAKALLSEFGFSSSEFSCLDSLWTKESNWTVNADNPTSSAYGIPQALPGSKMASAGADWATNPVTQIRWGLGYIQDRYGTPCSAWGHSQSHNWY